MNVYPVDSKKTMLSPQDIFIVAAHEDKVGLKAVEKAAKKVGATPERLYFGVLLKAYSDPKLIRIRSGNTLFTIAAFEGEVGFVRGYNGDTAKNYVNNIVELIQAAQKMGFQALVAHASEAVHRSISAAVHKLKDKNVTFSYDKDQEVVAIVIKKGKAE